MTTNYKVMVDKDVDFNLILEEFQDASIVHEAKKQDYVEFLVQCDSPHEDELESLLMDCDNVLRFKQV